MPPRARAGCIQAAAHAQHLSAVNPVASERAGHEKSRGGNYAVFAVLDVVVAVASHAPRGFASFTGPFRGEPFSQCSSAPFMAVFLIFSIEIGFLS